MNELCPIILAGGGGTRLWPLSRDLYPKQFLSLNRKESMLQLTLMRLDGLERQLKINKPLILCNEEHRFLVVEHAEQINKNLGGIILEPVRRNTAPALTVASLSLKTSDPIILMMPADHLIDNVKEFHRSVILGYEYAKKDMFVTFGVRPLSPEIGYGYINCNVCLSENNGLRANQIKRFVEKPDRIKAQEYIDSRDYYWNSGIFMMKASIWISAIKKYNKEIFLACEKSYMKGISDGQFYRLDKESFVSCPNDSIDYAVMEKITTDGEFSGVLVELDAGWSDIGSWSSVWDINEKDAGNNVFIGDIVANDTNNTIAISNNRLVATVGCNDLLIIETQDAVLVGDKSKAQQVKHIVETLKDTNRNEGSIHNLVHRPWGSYESLDNGNNYQVKRLTVKPGKKLSLQMHQQRSEHWVVVQGIATVTRGDETFDLNVNQSTYIPLGIKHRLENKQDTLLEVIEVQSGTYLGEDDIVRFEDDFGRHN